MKLGKVFIALLVLFIPIFATAQEEFTRTISAENKVAIFENFKKNIAIDKENYNISLDYIDNNKDIIIFSGKARDVGRLTANTLKVLTGEIDFKMELKYDHTEQTYTLKAQKMVFKYRAGTNSDFEYMSRDILSKLSDELTYVKIYGPDFELTPYFIEKVKEYKSEMESHLANSENLELKKKERKRAQREYESSAIKYKVYDSAYSEMRYLMTMLYLYYFE